MVASLVGPEASAYAFANGTDRTVIRVSGEWRWGSGGLGQSAAQLISTNIKYQATETKTETKTESETES